jgi:hypothetical protein
MWQMLLVSATRWQLQPPEEILAAPHFTATSASLQGVDETL